MTSTMESTATSLGRSSCESLSIIENNNNQADKMLMLAAFQRNQDMQAALTGSETQLTGKSIVNAADKTITVETEDHASIQKHREFINQILEQHEHQSRASDTTHPVDATLQPGADPKTHPSWQGIVDWTPELDSALKQLDSEHSGDWKRIGLRMNLHPELCRLRLENLVQVEEEALSEEERAALQAAKERRLRRETEIKLKSERNKFFRKLRKRKQEGTEDDHSKLQVNTTGEQQGADQKSSGGEKEPTDSEEISTTPGSPSKPRPVKRTKTEDTQTDEWSSCNSNSVRSETNCENSIAVVSGTDSASSPNQDGQVCVVSLPPSFKTQGEKVNEAEPMVCESNGRGFTEEDEEEEGESPLKEVDLQHQDQEESSPRVRYREGFFFRVTKILPGKKKNSLGFVALPKDITFAKARKKMSFELDLKESWAFYLPSLGPVSRRQESSLGAMVSWLSVKRKEMAGSRRNPIDIIIVNKS